MKPSDDETERGQIPASPPETAHSESIDDKIERFFKTFRSEKGENVYYDNIKRMPLTGLRSLTLDINDLIRFEPELARTILEAPPRQRRELLSVMERVLREIIEKEDEEYAESVELFHIRLKNAGTPVEIRQLRKEHVGRLVCVEGIVSQATESKPLVTDAAFRCRRCGELTIIKQNSQVIKPPLQCLNTSCGRNGPFEFIWEESKHIDFQKINIQEKPEDLPPGQLPHNFPVYLLDDLVGTVLPGNRVKITGTIHAELEKTAHGGLLRTSRIYLEANYIEIEDVENFVISEEDKAAIIKISRDPNVYQNIVNSIAPSIYGLDHVKEAIALQLFGGVPKKLEDGTKIRGEINMLLIGDPGTAKSQLLEYASRIAPRGLYTSGKGTTAAGLTAAMVKDPSTGILTLEAGALVLADRGIACVDEIDKMDEKDRVAIHEAMEQGTVSIAKAGKVVTLNARTSLLAAANPSFGQWNPYRSPRENINLPVTILSRFDLIFVIQDKPNPQSDKLLAQHIVNLHRHTQLPSGILIPPDLLRKYISYARTNCFPRLNEEAARAIEEFYLQMRAQGEGENASVPITVRQLESLIRLAEGSARLVLRDEVIKEDAQHAIALMNRMLRTLGVDPNTLRLDIQGIILGEYHSQKEKARFILNLIGLEEVSEEEVLHKAADAGFSEEETRRYLAHLKKDNMIYSTKPGFLKRYI